MQVKVEKQPKSTIKLDVKLPNENVKKTYNEVLEEIAKTAELPGFRKGQAPKNLVEEKTKPSELYGEVVNRLLETYYPQAIKENKISPISNPKVEIKEFELEKDFEFTAYVAIRPEIKLKDYKKAVKKAYDDYKKEHKEHDHEVKLSPNLIIKALVEDAKLEVADLLVEDEVNRMFSRIIQQTQALGMSMEEFLKAQGKTVEEMQEMYKKDAEESIKAEFILSHLIEQEKIEVTDSEIEEMIDAVGDEKTKEQMQSPIQKLYIKTVLAKNKLLTKIIEDLEDKPREENKKEENK